MKATLAAAVLVAAAASAPAAVDSYMTFVTLPQAVKLGDGSILPAGGYDVKIAYKGFGNAAEFLFLKGGVLMGKTPAEARGFPSQAPPVSTARKAGEGQKDFFKYDQKGVKLETEQKADVKLDTAQATDTHIKRVDGESTHKDHKGEIALAPQGFSWGAHGFAPGIAGKIAPAGKSLKLSFDSANSAAGFNAILPYVEKKK
ncbi:MAG TPA: hypothetical protein VGM13_03660 [Thermoanaerobaculia bacterium]|jgi:hypothetical protein